MTIRLLEKTDIAVIVNGFKESGWQIKPVSVFEQEAACIRQALGDNYLSVHILD